MKKDLEAWLRGKTAQASEAVQVPDTDAGNAEETISEVQPEPVQAGEGEIEDIEEAETAVEKFPVKDLSEAEDGVEAPNGAEVPNGAEIPDGTETPVSAPYASIDSGGPDENGAYDNSEDNHEYNEKRPAGELLEEAGSRLSAMRMTRMNESQRVGHTYGRSGFRRNRRRFFTVCAIAVIIAGTAIALFRSTQRNSYDAIMERAAGLYEQKQYDAAFEAYGDASRRYPGRPEPFLGTAHTAERMGRVEDSIAAYRASLECFPPDDAHSRAGVFYEIGRLYSTLKAWEKAQESFEEAIAADAANYGAYFSLGDALEEQGLTDRAFEAYSQALELSPASDAAQEAVKRVSLALAVKEEEDEDALVEQKYTQAFNSGNASLLDKQYREASQYFAEALAIRSDDADAWVGFAEARDKLGDAGGARKSLERALERDPEHETAKSRLAEMADRDKKPANPTRNTTPRRRNSSGASRGSTSRSAAATKTAQDGRETIFNAGVEQYLKGEYEASFNSFTACLRSSETGPISSVPSAGLAGAAGPVWKAPQAVLNLPSEASLLAEIVRRNPEDRNLYVNLSMAGAQMGIDRETLRSMLNEARSHASARTGGI